MLVIRLQLIVVSLVAAGLVPAAALAWPASHAAALGVALAGVVVVLALFRLLGALAADGAELLAAVLLAAAGLAGALVVRGRCSLMPVPLAVTLASLQLGPLVLLEAWIGLRLLWAR